METFYISGRMTGLPDWGRANFQAAEEFLKEQGHAVINPASSFAGRTDLPREAYIRMDVHLLLNATGIFLLSNWQESQGAKLEYAIAKELGLVIQFQNPEADLGERELMETAQGLIGKLLRRGHAQGHGPKIWLTEPLENHLLKSARHALTTQLMLSCLSPSPDAAGETVEDHLERAAIRALMALAVFQRKEQPDETLERR